MDSLGKRLHALWRSMGFGRRVEPEPPDNPQPDPRAERAAVRQATARFIEGAIHGPKGAERSDYIQAIERAKALFKPEVTQEMYVILRLKDSIDHLGLVFNKTTGEEYLVEIQDEIRKTRQQLADKLETLPELFGDEAESGPGLA